jgi:hypothetical protein
MSFKRNDCIVCKDGFTMSVQHGEGLYCEPRINNAERYTEVEVGFPSNAEPLLAQYQETLMDMEGEELPPTESVYPYVPSCLIPLICMSHGGIVRGELPPGVMYVTAELMEELK